MFVVGDLGAVHQDRQQWSLWLTPTLYHYLSSQYNASLSGYQYHWIQTESYLELLVLSGDSKCTFNILTTIGLGTLEETIKRPFPPKNIQTKKLQHNNNKWL